MNSPLHSILSVISWGWRQRHRFFKFGMVGISGIVINQAAIWICYAHVFATVGNLSLRLNLSMAVGILLSMTNNFHWNRRWTWKDRTRAQELPIVRQYLQYAAANWAGIVVQVAITNLLTNWMPYLLANLAGIGVGCGVNFILNDLWTYRHVHTDGIDPEARQPARAQLTVPLIISGLIFSLCTYLHGLGSLHILRNGDELVYMHLTRATSLVNRWLPLQGIPGMRNTKPPLLFWQHGLGEPLVGGGIALAQCDVDLRYGVALRPAGVAVVRAGCVQGGAGGALLSGVLQHLSLRAALSYQPT